VGDIVEDGPGNGAAPYVYSCGAAGSWPDPDYVVRTADPTGFAATLRRVVGEIDRSRAVFNVRPLEDVMSAAVDAPRVTAGAISGFAIAAMLLAAMGLYGLFTLLVAESRREIGVRLALGATPRDILQRVAGGAARLISIGLVTGLVLTAAAERLWRTLLFGVGPLDAATWIAATATLVVVAAAAVAIPSAAAARVAPTEALRE